MNTQSNALPDVVAPATLASTRPLYWSVLRELWENRSVYLAPLAVAAVFLIGFIISLIRLRLRMPGAPTLHPGVLHAVIGAPFEIAEGLIMAAAVIIQFFYSLEALHGERRDRSILFWKSMPVSDITTVLSKLSIVAAVPLLAFVIIVATQLIMLMLSNVLMLGSGVSVPEQWAQASVFPGAAMLLYHLVTVHILWYAPIYGWLFLVSAWARRAVFLWALLPPLALGFIEKMIFDTSHFARLMLYRFTGPEPFTSGAANGVAMDPMAHLSLGNFLSTPGLWIGLAIAAAFLAGAVRLRRSRGPI